MSPSFTQHRLSHPTIAVAVLVLLSACGGSSDAIDVSPVTTAPAAPADQGAADTAPVPSTTAFVDVAATNQRGDAHYATLDTNAGVRVIGGFLKIWQPLTTIVDAGVTAPAVDGFPAVVGSTWTGVPNDGTNGGTILDAATHNANIGYVVQATTTRTAAQTLAAYLDDRRNKGYSMSDSMGPLTGIWRSATGQTTTITDMAADSTTTLYNDGGNNTGVGGSANASFGKVVDLINSMGNNGSTEPAQRFFKYARPYRWSSAVQVVPNLVPAKSGTPTTDGGFPSGHAAEATRDAMGMAYVLPERYQQIVARGLELGENRILAGMHSPLDVMGGRVQAQAVGAANLIADGAAMRAAALAQAHTTMLALTRTTDATFAAYAESGTPDNDRFADYAANKANYIRRMTYGLPQTGPANLPASVPKGAEVLLESRLPYLSDAQRRVVLKTTAIASGYPVLDDAEGWGRLNLFAAADGYAAFTGNVVVIMDASKGGFNAVDRWRNDITGSGKLVKQGTGMLKLGGNNSWTGGVQIDGGALEADANTAFGNGDVYVGSAGTLESKTPGQLAIGGNYAQLDKGTLNLTFGTGNAGTLAVKGAATIVGGTLHLKFASGFTPTVGATYQVLSAASRKGVFTSVVVDGYKGTLVYDNRIVSVHIDS
jgi:autotransporter-associated beta strand protein